MCYRCSIILIFRVTLPPKTSQISLLFFVPVHMVLCQLNQFTPLFVMLTAQFNPTVKQLCFAIISKTDACVHVSEHPNAHAALSGSDCKGNI